MNKIHQIRAHLEWITAQTPMTDQCYWSDEVKRHAKQALTALSDLEKEYAPIPEGGVEDTVSLEAAIKYWNHDINMEMRDPCGMAASSKAAWALLRHIAQLEKEQAWQTVAAIVDSAEPFPSGIKGRPMMVKVWPEPDQLYEIIVRDLPAPPEGE